ncbi:MAG: WxcM-like domain-containing protein [Planctomycetota bacterium]
MHDPVNLTTIRPRPVRVFSDARGELWKSLCLSELAPNASIRECYTLFTHKGQVRGNHFHRRTTEWFIVVQGRMKCTLAVPGSEQRSEVILDAAAPALLEMPPGVAHRLCAESDETTILLAGADQEYDRAEPDAVPYDF